MIYVDEASRARSRQNDIDAAMLMPGRAMPGLDGRALQARNDAKSPRARMSFYAWARVASCRFMRARAPAPARGFSID